MSRDQVSFSPITYHETILTVHHVGLVDFVYPLVYKILLLARALGLKAAARPRARDDRASCIQSTRASQPDLMKQVICLELPVVYI